MIFFLSLLPVRLPLLRRSLPFSWTYARDFSKKKITIYLTWEPHMYTSQDLLVTFISIYFFYVVTLILVLLFSKTRQHFNFFFGLIGRFVLLKDINIYFFLLLYVHVFE